MLVRVSLPIEKDKKNPGGLPPPDPGVAQKRLRNKTGTKSVMIQQNKEAVKKENSMAHPMMKCGHAANATSNGKPACVICAGISGGANMIVNDNPPNLSGRKARCSYYGTSPKGRNYEGESCKRGEVCKCERDSSEELAFFEYCLGKDFDKYYCGCWGWD